MNRTSLRWFYGCLACLAGTLLLGIALRWVFTGWTLPWGLQFKHLKHAHSHLGYYGVMFPIVWLFWRHKGSFQLHPIALVLYAIGIVMSTIGFVRAGYAIDSIIGSTLVGLVWLVSAWKQRRELLQSMSWLSSAPLGILLASCMIPPIAVYTRKDPAFALQLVQTFLSLLIFLVALPSVLKRLNMVAPWTLYWLICGISGSLFVGIVPHPVLGLGLVGMASWVFWGAFGDEDVPRDQQVMWLLWAMGLAALGLELVPNNHLIAIAGIHLTLLGPFLAGAALTLVPRPGFPSWLRWVYITTLFVMVGAIGIQHYHPHHEWSYVSAVSGSLLGLWITWAAIWLLRQKNLTLWLSQTEKSDIS